MTLVSDRSLRHEGVAAYAQPRLGRGLLDVATSAGPYLGLCVAMYVLLGVSPLIVVVLPIPTSGFLVRVFVVFHDCAHGSLLPSRRANTWVGTVLGLLVLSPFGAFATSTPGTMPPPAIWTAAAWGRGDLDGR
jgi:omega-6 fatty acid desaturase (delta-12 desaturase)